MKKVVMILLSILLLTGCSQTDSEKFKKEYEELNGTTNLITLTIDATADIKYVSAKQTVSLLKEGTGIIYFGFPNCPWCRNMLPVLLEAASNNNMTVSYLNPRKLRDSKNKQFQEIMDILNEYLLENEEGSKMLYVPDVYFVKNGKIVGHHLGTVESQSDPTIPLTDEQKQELKGIYEELIGQVK